MSSGYTVFNNVTPIDPSLMDLLNLFKKDIFLTLNCHAIGTVQSFNSTNQTAAISINYTKVFQVNGANGPEAQLRSYPVLFDCPVIFLRGNGGTAYLSFPIKVNDECLIFFNDRDIENWFTNGGNVPNTNRLHSFSDAIALVGLWPSASSTGVASIPDFDMDRAVLKMNQAQVAVGFNNLIKIANNTYTLNQILQQLISTIQAITVIGVKTGTDISGPPSNIGDFTTIANQLNDLLE